MTPEQIQSARTLLTQPENSVSSIAKLLGVSRSTIYKYVLELTKLQALQREAELQPEAAAIIAAPQPAQPAPAGRNPACPNCDYRPTDSRELELHRDGLATIWLTLDPDHPGRIIERRHCERCQPHRARIVMCGRRAVRRSATKGMSRYGRRRSIDVVSCPREHCDASEAEAIAGAVLPLAALGLR
jgi:hypothetical protein